MFPLPIYFPSFKVQAFYTVPETPTTFLPPSTPTTPFLKPNLSSISSFLAPCSRIISTCLSVTTSKNRLPGAPFLPTLLNSSSASSANFDRAARRLTAGFWGNVEPGPPRVGKMVCEGLEGRNCAFVWLNVEEFESVGLATTGPSWRARASRAMSGSDASSVTALKVVQY